MSWFNLPMGLNMKNPKARDLQARAFCAKVNGGTGDLVDVAASMWFQWLPNVIFAVNSTFNLKRGTSLALAPSTSCDTVAPMLLSTATRGANCLHGLLSGEGFHQVGSFSR